MDSWINTPFEYHFINLRRKEIQTNLPFAITGLTQQGVEHKSENRNNQDSTGIIVEENLIAGIVCDGCSGTVKALYDDISNNEIGAKLTVRILIKVIKEVYTEKSLADGPTFVRAVKDHLLEELKRLVDIVCEDNEKDKQIFIADFLLATVFCVVADEKNCIVFYCGDGVIGINGKIEVMDEPEFISVNLLKTCCPTRFENADINRDFKIYFYGESSELESIFLASDGFNEIVTGFKDQVVDLIRTDPVKNGFFDIKPDFRAKVLENEGLIKEIDLKNCLEDDASFILLKKINLQKKLS